MKKRILSMLLTIVMVVGLMPTATAADGDALTTVEQLQAAINEGGTVKLGGNIDLGSSVLTFPDNIPVTIDLNGNTLSKSSSGFVLELGAGDDVTITGEGTVSKAGGWYFFKNDSGYLKIEGGTYSKSGYDLVYMGGNSVTEITGGTFALDNIFARQSDNSTGTISGGMFIVNTISTGIWSSGITITGGTYTLNTADTPVAGFVDADKYSITTNADGSYTVGEKEPVATYVATMTTSGGETSNHTDLQKAIEAAQANPGSTLKLLDNVSTDTHFIVESGSFTIDLNGHTVTGTGASNANPSAFSIATNANTYTSALQITFTDSSEYGDGAVVSQNGPAVKVNAYALGNGVDVVLEKGSYHGNTYGLEVNTKNTEVTVQDGVSITATNTFGSAVAINGGVLTMNGGTLDGVSADFDFGARTATDATLDLSGCSDPDGMTILARRAMPVAQIKLPDGYGIFGADNTQYAADATVERNSVVTIKSTKTVTYTVTVAADKTEATVGETVTLTAVVTADGNVVSDAHVDWEAPTGNGLDALGSLQATITPGSAGEIEVKAFYDPTPEDVENDDVVEGSVTVTAKETPVITVEFEPNNQITTEGKIIESLLYQVSVSDGSTPSYQWYQCDDAGRTNARAIEGATRMGFDLPKDLTEGKYYYYCVASAEGAESTTSRVSTVTVKKSYNFTVAANPAEGGTVTAAVGSNNNITSAIEGTNIRLSAAANEGYHFVGWTVDGSVVSTEANYVFIMPAADASVTASFEKEKEKLSVTQTVSEANWYPDMSMRVSNLEDFFTVTKADGSAFTMFDVAVTDSQGTPVEYLENAGTYTVTLTMGAYYQKNYTLSQDTFTFTVKPLDLTSTRVGTFTALNPTYTGQTALPTATTSGKLNFRVYIYNAFVGSEKMYTVDANDGLWEFAAIDGKNSVKAGDAWANVVSKSSNIIGTYEYKYTIKQAEMDVPTGLVAVNETIDGKGDGKITGLTTAMEYSTSKYGTYTPVTDVNMLFEDDTYYVRTAALSENHKASDPVELTIEAGRKLTVTLPSEQQHYTLTASKTELSWHGSTTLTIDFDTGYGAGEDFAVLVNDEPVTPANNKVTVSDVEEDLVVTVTGVQANRYTVTFDTNGGEAIDPITVTYGEKYGRLPSSAVTGLSSGDSNWYLVDGSGNVTDTKITNLSVVTTARNHTLKVVRKVLAPTLKITLEVPGAISNNYQYYVPGNSTRVLTAAVNNENKDVLNYTYQWYKDGTPIEGATEAVLTLAGNVSDSGTYKVVVTATLKDDTGITVTASSASGEKEQTVKILHVANTLSYEANGGENAPGSHYTGGATITVASDVPSREHYTFAGWNTKADGSGDSYSAGSTYTFADDNGNGGCKVTLYAKWTANTYAVTLVTNQGTIRDGDVTEYTYSVGAVLPTNVTRPGYRFAGWYDNEDCTGDPVTEITDTEYGDKTFYAKWKRNSTGSGYRPEINDDGNGDVSVYPTKPEKGDIVTIRPDPDKGYEVDKVTVTDKNGRPVKVVDNGDGTYGFKQPDGKVEITVTFKEIGAECERNHTCPMYGYTDLSMTAWYHDGVHFCLEEGLMNGISNDQFAPDGTTTRAMIVTILWRLEGKPVVNYLMQFDDVAADMWYTEAIRWAASEKIVEGYGDTFGPNDPITREQMAAIMWRYAKYCGYDVSVGENTNILSYDDAFDVSDWAMSAMQWACGAGLINGIENGNAVNLAPNGNTTRVQAAAILYRFCK